MSAARPGSALRYAFLQASIFVALGVYLPFFPSWLETRGLSADAIGVVLAVASWSRILTTPALLHLSDTRFSHKAMLVLFSLAALAGFALLQFAHGLFLIAALHLLAATAFYPQPPLADAMVMHGVKHAGLNYGRIRLCGSLSFIVGSLAMGALLDRLGARFVLFVLLAALAVNVAGALAIVPTPPAEPAQRSSFRGLLKNTELLRVALVVALIRASHAVYYAFSVIDWRSHGVKSSLLGWLWAEGVVAEIMLFFVAGRWAIKGRVQWLLMLAAAGGFVRWGLYAASRDLGVLIAGQLLHALSFGAAHLATMNFIANRAPSDLQASAQSLFAASSGGLGMGLGLILAGLLYERYEGLAYVAMAGLCVVALGLCVQLSAAERSRVGA